ncbi:MAG: hypothetical protein AB7Q97_15905 [Gammaproteobacteria bacterium]
MCHAFLSDSNFWALLFRIDEDLAAQIRAGGCPHCGGALHQSNYPRKPRGVARAVLGPQYEQRLSLCCSREGCRRRRTPASVRFLGARVYLGAVVTLVSALAHGLNGRRAALLCAQFGTSVRTLERWRQWWTQRFVATSLWSQIRGRLASAVAPAQLPAGLLERVSGADVATRMTQLLGLLAPLTTSPLSREGV